MTGAPDTWPSGFEGPHLSPGFLFWRDFMRWQRGLNEALKPLGLTQPQFALLAVYGWLNEKRRIDVTQQVAADFVGLDRMHVSQVSARLERDGLIDRAAHSADGRAKRIVLTPAGRARLASALGVVEAYDRGFFDGVGSPAADRPAEGPRQD